MSSSIESKYRPKNLPIYFTYRTFKLDSFFVGLFGASAVFGVLLKIWKKPFWGLVSAETGTAMYDIFMPVGFLGEAVVFIIMGFMKGDAYIEVYPDEQEDNNATEEDAATHGLGGVVVNMQLPDSLKKIIEDKVSAQLDNKVSELTNLLVSDIQHTRNLLSDTNQMNGKIVEVAGNLNELSTKIKSFGDSLGEFEKINSSNISKNAAAISTKLESANNELQVFEDEMKKLANRFRNFNSPN
jgi:methyl-accepting chemotaxis protein